MAQHFDQAEASSQTTENEVHNGAIASESLADDIITAQVPTDKRGGFDWLALSIVILIAAVFAIAGRLYAQPTTSLVPVAVLSASGCGLLITALRKLHSSKGVGLLEAAFAALFVVVFQFIAALSYPGVVPSLGNEQLAGPGFFSTWGLIAFFSILFSIIGATLGHLAFAPLRPLPAHRGRKQSTHSIDSDQDETPEYHEQELLSANGEEQSSGEAKENDAVNEHTEVDEAVPVPDVDDISSEEQDNQVNVPQFGGEAQTAMPQRTVINYAITVLLLGFVPMLAGYVFAAAFDYTLSRNGYAPGPFPTLRLLSSLLPWQVPDPVGPLTASSPDFTLSLLWRIPLFFGNPAPFDAQAIEPYIFNAAGSGLLLLTSFKQENVGAAFRLSWSKLIFLEALLGLAIVLPADLWMIQGLQGALQFHSLVLPLGTLRLLDPLTFVLNILMGVALCATIGAIVATRRKRG